MKIEAMRNGLISVVVPAGKYVLGDPCYSVPDALWLPLLKSCDYFVNPIGTVNGVNVLAFSTMYGDGEYRASNGENYPVDAGLIGLVPYDFAEINYPYSVTIVTFDEPTYCYKDGQGTLTFGDIDIYTGLSDDEYDFLNNEWDGDDCENEDED